MRNKKEYELSKAVAKYLRSLISKPIYHFDLAGQNMSKAQSGMMAAIQGQPKWPDLFISEPRNQYHGLFIELKIESPFKKDGNIKSNDHLKGQQETLLLLKSKGYKAVWGVGYDDTINEIEKYLNQ